MNNRLSGPQLGPCPLGASTHLQDGVLEFLVSATGFPPSADSGWVMLRINFTVQWDGENMY